MVDNISPKLCINIFTWWYGYFG